MEGGASQEGALRGPPLAQGLPIVGRILSVRVGEKFPCGCVPW